jgi:Zn-dependent M28 family amino/carboxypeptidase
VGGLSGAWPVEIRGQPFTITTRDTDSGPPIYKATLWAGDHLAELGLQVERHIWGSPSAPNVIGELQGETRPQDIFIIGAHLDDAPPDYIAPGADDNASGSTAVLIAADILSHYRWGCTLRFALWTGEEQWTIEEPYAHGSQPYARRSRERGENIVGVLNLDMIGWNTEGTLPDLDLDANAEMSPTVQLAQLFMDVVEVYGLNLVPHIRPDSRGEGDYGSFWDHGYTAIMGIEYEPRDFNPHYHTRLDKLENLDMAYLTEFIKAGVGTFAHASGCLMGPSGEHRIYLPMIVHGAGG